MTTSVDDLRKIPLFSRLSDVDLQFLATKMDEIIAPAGTTLITEGMGNHAFFLLANGEVDVFVGGTHRRTLGPNDFFGEISMMVLEPATATAQVSHGRPPLRRSEAGVLGADDAGRRSRRSSTLTCAVAFAFILAAPAPCTAGSARPRLTRRRPLLGRFQTATAAWAAAARPPGRRGS